MRRRRQDSLASVTALLASAGLLAASCGPAASHATSGPPSGSPATSGPAGPPRGTGSGATVGAPLSTGGLRIGSPMPVAWDCGGGAYEPSTLYILCSNTTTLATGITWRTWRASSAAGSGTVHESVGGKERQYRARLRLSDPEREPGGLEFTRLQVTWTGASPDGRPSDTYALQTG